MSQDLGPTVTVKRDILKYFNDSLERIVKSHSVHLRECDNVCVKNETPSDSVVFRVSQHSLDNNKQCLLSEAASYIQKYADSLANGDAGGAGGTPATEPSEDSSYDSDFETDDATTTSASHADGCRASSGAGGAPGAPGAAHRDVARTVSDTLAAEFAEYVNVGSSTGASSSPDRDAAYTQRVEFALKLGYTERLVRAALAKLGPNPEQNELLAELIRLGAQCPRQADSPPDGEPRSPDSTSSRDVGTVIGSDSFLRHIVIDGSNVAMSHGNKEVFSCRGIKICVDWFRARGHQEITVFVPKWRKEAGKPDSPIADREILEELERERLLVFTPSRLVGGKRLICYDDRYVLRLASETDGIVVSNDNYRDLAQENPDFRRVIEERLLMYSFVNDRFMPPDDPLGRTGPDLERFLRCRPRTDPPPPCPYARKCTYGNKCKFDHPERGSRPHKSVTERLSEGAARALRARARDLHAVSLPLPAGPAETQPRKTPLARAVSATPSSVRGLQPIGPPAFDPMVAAHFERAQLQNMQPHLHHSLHPHLQQHQHKSHSVENVTRLPPPDVAYCWRPTTPERPSWNYSSPSPQGPVCDPAEGVNPHRKLQRQLTLNPLCEPQQWRTLTPPEHAAAARVASAPGAPGASCPPGVPLAAPPSVSEPALHLWEARRRMHYHLASIFPEDQVCQAMAMYPEETDAQKICAVILSLFHKH